MGNLFAGDDQQKLVERILQLSPDACPLWGKMTVNEMLCHITDPFRDALGFRDIKPVALLLRPAMRMLLLSRRPFRKNMPTAKSYLQGRKGLGTKPVNFAYDRAIFINLLNKLCTTDENYPLRPHAVAGRLERKQYGYLLWKHTHHHLRQFGV